MDLDLESNGPLLDRLFPTRMSVKVIAVDLQGIEGMLIARLSELGIAATCAPGHHSRKGKYITWEVEALFDTRATFHAGMTALAQVDGVKYVL